MQRKVRLLLPAILCCILALGAQAQTSKGTFLLGGSLNYSHRTADRARSSDFTRVWETQKSFTASPESGYFIMDNLVVGTGLMLNVNRSLIGDHKTQNSQGLGISPFARYYNFIGEKLAFFGQAAVGFNKYTQKNIDHDLYGNTQTPLTSKGLTAILMPGLSYFPTPRMGLQFSMGYLDYSKIVSEGRNTDPQSGVSTQVQNTQKSFTANFGLSKATIGINFFLSK